MTHPMHTFGRLLLPLAVAGLFLLVVVTGLRASGPSAPLSPLLSSVDQPDPAPVSSQRVGPSVSPTPSEATPQTDKM